MITSYVRQHLLRRSKAMPLLNLYPSCVETLKSLSLRHRVIGLIMRAGLTR